jgi:hypothetical protein
MYPNSARGHGQLIDRFSSTLEMSRSLTLTRTMFVAACRPPAAVVMRWS